MKTDVYDKIINQIIAELEIGVRPWHKPRNAEHAAGRITRPLRANGIPYQGINVLMLWSAAMEEGYAAPIWMALVRPHGDNRVRTHVILTTPAPRFLQIPHTASHGAWI